jgi:hypothetical protein
MIAHQKGLYTVEFAIVGSVFLITLLSIIELGIVLLTWNALSEATRRGARVAVVCPVDDPAIKNIAMFDSPTGTNGSLIAGLSAVDIDVAYLDSAGVAILDTVANYIDIEFVRVSINDGYSFPTILPWLSSIVNAPPFRTTLPRESLGVSRESVDACIV